MPKTLKSLLVENTTQSIFEGALSAWARRDVDGVLPFFSDDMTNNINVDPAIVPFAYSVVGKNAYREKLRGILNKFEFGAYVTEHMSVSGRTARANMKIIWVHSQTGEQLSTRFRFVAEQRNGLIVRLDQYYDAPYVEAFARLVSMRARC